MPKASRKKKHSTDEGSAPEENGESNSSNASNEVATAEAGGVVSNTIAETLDTAIDEMLAQLDTAEPDDIPVDVSRDSVAAERHSRPSETEAIVHEALLPINQTLRQQSEAMVGLTQALQGLQLAFADFQHSRQFEHITPAPTKATNETFDVKLDEEASNAPVTSQSEDESGSQEQCWNQIKAALLNQDAPDTKEVPADDESVAESEEPVFDYDLVPHAEIQEMDAEQLRSLLLDQERVISRLVRTARAERKASLSLTPDDLREHADNLPEDLAAQVRATLQTLDEQARLGELELSLERARISRQLSHLEDTRQVLESNARALGLEISPEGKIVGDPKSVRNAGSKGRRWLGALGFGD